MNKIITFNDIPGYLLELGQKLDTLLNKINNSSQSGGEDETMDIETASQFLMVSKATLYRYCNYRKIKYYKREKKLYFLKSDLVNFITDGGKLTLTEIKSDIIQKIKK